VYCKHTSFDEVKWLECEQCPYKAKSEVFLKVDVINKHTTPEEIRGGDVCEQIK
jgi:hypothetical protein